MPFPNLKIVSKELLETKHFTTWQLSLLKTLLPFNYQIESILLCESSGHSDIACGK